jgi:hypothetical protein
MEKQVYVLKWKQTGVMSRNECFADKKRAEEHCEYNNSLLHLTRMQKILGRYWVVKPLVLIR